MRIGKFAETNKLSIDSIRYYMDLGLIIPEKRGGQYYFDERCQSDLNHILSLKAIGFTLKDIKSLFMFKRIGRLTPYEENKYYKEFFINKYTSVLREIEELNHIKEKLEDKIKDLSKNENKEKVILGVDIKYLNIFKCLKCGRELILFEAHIDNNQIINGKLRCSCGEEYVIESGILKVNNSYKQSEERFDYDYISKYINFTDEIYLDTIYKGLEWAYKRLDFNEFKNKVILELGSGVGIFLRHIYSDLPQDCLYIAVDHDMERHRFLKSMIERSECKRNIIFICSDFLQIPIKDKLVDMLVDFSGTTNYSFKHEEFLLRVTDNYVKESAYLLGAYILFKNFSVNSLIQEQYRKNFIMKNIKEEIAKLRYKSIDENISECLEKGGRYEDYFVEGEKVYDYIFYGKR